jgi:hypothetical protein
MKRYFTIGILHFSASSPGFLKAPWSMSIFCCEAGESGRLGCAKWVELAGRAGTDGAPAVLNSGKLVNRVEYLLFTISEVPPPSLVRGLGTLLSWPKGPGEVSPFRPREGTAEFKLLGICRGALIGGRREVFLWRRENPLLFSSISDVIVGGRETSSEETSSIMESISVSSPIGKFG